jgi:hypothetical protein
VTVVAVVKELANAGDIGIVMGSVVVLGLSVWVVSNAIGNLRRFLDRE